MFAGDQTALAAARLKINEEYRKNKDCSDADKVQEMIKFSEAVETELRCTVVQAVQSKDGKFGRILEIINYLMSLIPFPPPAEANFRKDVQRLDNVPFDEFAILDVKPRRSRKCKPVEEQ